MRTGANWILSARILKHLSRRSPKPGTWPRLFRKNTAAPEWVSPKPPTILEEIHRSGGNAAACHAQMYVMGTLLWHGSETQKKKYLPALARGELRLQAFGVSEPTTGSDTTQMKTFARREGDKYVVKGQKIWISRAEHSDLMLLVARTTPMEQVKKRSEGLSVLLVDLREARNHGLTIRPIRTMMNHATTEVFFDDVEVPAENLVGEEGQGFRYLLDGLNAERILSLRRNVLAMAVGSWSEPAATPKIASSLGGRLDRIRAFSSLLLALIPMSKLRPSWSKKPRRSSTRQQPCGPQANMAKLLAADASWESANATVQTYGGFGFAEEYDVERKFRETRLYQVAPVPPPTSSFLILPNTC